jgi:enoyl-CoA hydratase/carnithine racemase
MPGETLQEGRKKLDMSIVDLRREGDVFILTMQAGENRFNPSFIGDMNQALDQVENSTGPAALVTVGGEEKFYSNGLDLGWLMGEGIKEWKNFIPQVLKFLGRLMAFPVPTVAAINGHAFAAGAMLALAHDYRIMRADRGFFCLPEVDIKIPLAPGMRALIQSRLSPVAFRDMILTGARIGGSEAKEKGIVDEAVSPDQVLPRAVARATALAGKDRRIYENLKRGMYAEALALLESGEADFSFFSP